MNILSVSLLWTSAMLAATGEKLGPGDHERLLYVGEGHRSYTVHVPPGYDSRKPVAVVLALHGAGTNGYMMSVYSGLSEKADQSGFVVVYPNGTGTMGTLLTWNSGGMRRASSVSTADDVGYIGKVLDDVESCLAVDAKRVYAAGMSNGAMMCYRLAAEMSDRIAAIAPVAGTIAIDNYHPKRPVPVIHFHGTVDRLVAFDGPANGAAKSFGFKSVPETMRIVAACNGCASEPEITELPDKAHDGTRVTRKVFAAKESGAEAVFYVIEGGGHTWPGQQPPIRFLGKSTKQISANDLIWDFFQKHPMKQKAEKLKS
jgi:polyhydroxybutyrate depolymerase